MYVRFPLEDSQGDPLRCCMVGAAQVRLAALTLLVKHAHVAALGLAEVLDQLLRPPQWKQLHSLEQVSTPLSTRLAAPHSSFAYKLNVQSMGQQWMERFPI